jgi:O-antigen/teichoic acid export membrane protein
VIVKQSQRLSRPQNNFIEVEKLNEKSTIKFKVISSLFWKLIERGGNQGIQFIVQIILARLLVPEEFGTVALLSVFISLANVFVQSGFNTALIQKKNADERDFSSVFYLTLAIAGLLYAILFISAPYIGAFYANTDLVPLLRVLSIVLFIGALNSIQIAVLSRNLDFKKLFYSSFGGVIISGIVGISMAYMGFGSWALVAQQLSNQFFVAGILWFTVNWRPQLLFSMTRTAQLFSFGWKLLVSALINNLYQNSQSLIIGKLYTPAILAFFNRGQQFPSIIVTNIDGSIQSVMLPALSSQQDNVQRVKEMVRRSIVTSSFFVFPMMIGLAVIAEPLVQLLLTDKWLPCVPFLQISCATFALMPIHTANLQAVNALGRSDVFLKLEIIKLIVGLTILWVSISYGIYAIALGLFLSSILSTFINAYPNLKLLNYSYSQQMKDIIPSLLLAITMGVVIYMLSIFNLPGPIEMLIQTIIGGLFYFGAAWLLKLECFIYLIDTYRELVDKRKESKK